MKKNIRLFYLLLLLFPVTTAFAQKYKSIEDSTKLNKEYENVRIDILGLNSKLATAEIDLLEYEEKERKAGNDAANSASASSDKASKATNGNVNDAKIAKKKADKAYDEAKDSRSAKNKVSDQKDKISQYKSDIHKKQQRLEELDVMRMAINEKKRTDSLQLIQN